MENKGIARMNDISCHANDQFICEFDESVNLQGEKAGGTVDVSEQSKLLKPLANYSKFFRFHHPEFCLKLAI